MACVLVALSSALGSQPSPLSLTVSAESGERLHPVATPLPWVDGKCPSSSPSLQPDLMAPEQTIGGFGASMTEASAINLNSLPKGKQTELLELLFGASGARLSAIKATMLSNDFAAQADWSTYDDTPGDVALANFSIERDLRANGSLRTPLSSAPAIKSPRTALVMRSIGPVGVDGSAP